MDQLGINMIANGVPRRVWSEGLELVPLKQRLKLLLASHRDAKLDSECPALLPNSSPLVEGERENGRFGSQSQCFAKEWTNGSLSVPEEEGHAGELGESKESATHAHTSSTDSVVDSHGSLLAKFPVTVKIECAEKLSESTSADYLHGLPLAGIQSVTFEPVTSEEYLEELDHVALTERLRRLLASKCLGLTSSMLQEKTAAAVKRGLIFGDQHHEGFKNQMHEIDPILTSGTSKCNMDFSCKPHKELGNCSQGNRSTYIDDKAHSARKRSEYESSGGKILSSTDSKTAMPTLAKIKLEHPTFNKFQTSNVTMNDQISFRNLTNLIQVKSEVLDASDEIKDELDHVLLRDRMKLLPSRDDPNFGVSQSTKHTSKVGSSTFGFKLAASETAKSLKINRPRKRQKTVTDSVETAMEEDAPGLLKVLIEKGVSVNEIKLYGEPESNDALDDSSTNNNFVELEEIISKLFFQRESFLKFGPLRGNKGERASYCLECLFSLVEQARYLQFRKWPVEWGWCRDLQSFIFIFERHNRIVLERPEYGYATYFFELDKSSSIGWQIKRLVTAMKLTSCGRATLIENKALKVGDDLSEGEARVLMEYGWLPNTGLGTMLNYFDRVVHDRRSEDRSEWRSKIGKLLMDGINGGTIITTYVSPKEECEEYGVAHPAEIEIKLET